MPLSFSPRRRVVAVSFVMAAQVGLAQAQAREASGRVTPGVAGSPPVSTILLSNADLADGAAGTDRSVALAAEPPEAKTPVGQAVTGPSGASTDRPDREATDIAQLILRAARKHRVAADLIAAVAAAESRFDPRALSPKGAQGVMQLMPATARRFGVRDVWSAEDNIDGGAAYLRWLLDFFGGDTTLAVAAYNAGEQAVLRAGRRIPPYEETRRYVPKVLAWQAHYARALASLSVTR